MVWSLYKKTAKGRTLILGKKKGKGEHDIAVRPQQLDVLSKTENPLGSGELGSLYIQPGEPVECERSGRPMVVASTFLSTRSWIGVPDFFFSLKERASWTCIPDCRHLYCSCSRLPPLTDTYRLSQSSALINYLLNLFFPSSCRYKVQDRYPFLYVPLQNATSGFMAKRSDKRVFILSYKGKKNEGDGRRT